MTKEEIINLANRCSRKIWEICMEEPGFSTNDCPEGANGLSDIVLNIILKAFPAIKEYSSLPSNLDDAANSYASKTECAVVACRGFKVGAEWMESQTPMPEDTVIFMKGVAEGRRLEREDRNDDNLPRFYGD